MSRKVIPGTHPGQATSPQEIRGPVHKAAGHDVLTTAAATRWDDLINESQFMHGTLHAMQRRRMNSKVRMLEPWSWQIRGGKRCPNCGCGCYYYHPDMPYYKCTRCTYRFQRESPTVGRSWRNKHRRDDTGVPEEEFKRERSRGVKLGREDAQPLVRSRRLTREECDALIAEEKKKYMT